MRNVDAVAVDIVTLHDHVAEIDADAELELAIRRHARIALGLGALHLDRAAERVDHAVDLDEQPVAHGFDQSTMVRGDSRLETSCRSAWNRARVPSSSASLRRP